MKQLSRLSPAEAILLIKEKDANLRELLKATFLDLLIRRVLKIEIVEVESRSSRHFRTNKYISIDTNFRSVKINDQNMCYLSPFLKNNDIQILFRHLVKMGFQNAKSTRHFQKELINTPNLAGFIKQNFIQSIFGGFNLTPSGETIKNDLKKEIISAEQKIIDLLDSNPKLALEELSKLGGHAIHFKQIDFNEINRLEYKIVFEKEKTKQKEGDSETSGNGCCSGYIGCSGCSTWSDFDHNSSYFDNSCSNDSGCSSSSSGCSGCGSGCSGCGGGGCGGCG
jgi:hypothetical protein